MTLWSGGGPGAALRAIGIHCVPAPVPSSHPCSMEAALAELNLEDVAHELEEDKDFVIGKGSCSLGSADASFTPL